MARKDWSGLISDYQSKALTTKELTEKYGISRQRIHQILGRYGVEAHTRRRTKLTENDANAIAQAYRNLGSIKRVAEKFNTSEYQVNRALGFSRVFPLGNRIPEETVAEWKERYECGETMSEICRNDNVSINTVSKYLGSGKGAGRPRVREIVKDKILELYKSGKTISASASEAGCSAPTAARYIKEAGITRCGKTNKQRERILATVADHKSGMALADISAKHKVSEKILPGILSSVERK